MLRFPKPPLAVLLSCFLLLPPGMLKACCGFVLGQGEQLQAVQTAAIAVRDGEQTTLSLWMDVRGEAQHAGIILPVPQQVSREDVRILSHEPFHALEALSSPILSVYQDPSPCPAAEAAARSTRFHYLSDATKARHPSNPERFEVDLLPASRGHELAAWLRGHGFELPAGGSDSLLAPSHQQNRGFVLVHGPRQKLGDGTFAALPAVQVQYRTPDFELPLWPGLVNAGDFQDAALYVLSREGRVKPRDYPVRKLPTDYEVPAAVRDSFPRFYQRVARRTWHCGRKQEVLLEAAEPLRIAPAASCDTCTGLSPEQAQAIGLPAAEGSGVHLTRLHLRINAGLFGPSLRLAATANRQEYLVNYQTYLPAPHGKNCRAWADYEMNRQKRKAQWVKNVAFLTGCSEEEAKARISGP